MKNILYLLLFIPFTFLGQNNSYVEQDIPLSLPEGWSMFGFTCLEPINVINAFSLIEESVIIAKDSDGNAYIPEWDFNGIGDLEYSRGYQIKLTQEITDFQFCPAIVPLVDSDGDGVYDVDEIEGCMDISACNYNELATDVGICEFPIDLYDCDGNILPQEACPYDIYVEYSADAQSYNVDLCQTLIVYGCTDYIAENYANLANTEDNSCTYIFGCMDSSADNYNSEATQTNSSCIYLGCMDVIADNYNPQANQEDGNCIYYGCVNPTADNYDAQANVDDGSCIIYGCTLAAFPNYNSEATVDDFSCDMNSTDVFGCTDDTAQNYEDSANVDDGSCIAHILGCTEPGFAEYDAEATLDDGSCLYIECNEIGFFEDFDEYDAGEYLGTESNSFWTTWSFANGTTEDVLVTDENSYSPDNSINLVSGGNTDVLLGLGPKYIGHWTLKFMMQIESGYGAYFNLLHSFDGPNSNWAVQFYFNPTGYGSLNAGSQFGTTFNHPVGSWFEIKIDINIEYDVAHLYFDDTLVYSWPWSEGSNNSSAITALNLYPNSIDGEPDSYFIDDILFTCNNFIPAIAGCMDDTALNYNPDANTDDGTCEALVVGCTDSLAYNYNVNANIDDGSCIYPELNLTISEIQGMDEASPYIGSTVTTSGLIVAKSESSYFLQDSLGAWNGIYVYDSNDTLVIGNWISIIAVVAEYYDATQLNSVSSVSVLSTEFTNTPTQVTAAMCNTEDYEGVLVAIDVVQCVSEANSYGESEFVSEMDTITTDDLFYAFTPSVGSYYQLTGVIHYSYGNYKVNPRFESDVLEYIVGCMDSTMSNYNPDATLELESSCEDVITGCTDSLATNYNAEATVDDGSCVEVVYGCTGADHCNYNPEANTDDGSCIYPELGYDCDGNITAEIGDIMEGGYLFYIDETGQHGLVSALEDIGQFEWGCYGENVNGADGQAIGTGYQNTLDIVAQNCQTEYVGITAAQAALDAEVNGYSDWYLPSFNELYEMYSTIGQGGSEGNIGGFATAWYWSSSEGNNNYAWLVGFNDGTTSPYYKNSTYRVRVIRAF